MANQEHLDILKKGVRKWNKWRKEYSDIQLDLSGANLSGANLSGVIQSKTISGGVIGLHTYTVSFNLSEANLREADLSEADLSGANLSGTNLSEANLRRADLSKANLRVADLWLANLRKTNLFNADLRRANLLEANLSEANLEGANLSHAHMGSTILGDIDLSMVKGLETVRHHGPSIIDIITAYHSEAMIPEGFLQGIGVPDPFIDYMRSLVGKPIDYYTCFISYSSKDQDFAERLYADLQSKGVRCWFAPEDMKIGDKIRPRIDEAIRLYDKLLLVLSEHSVMSEWVEDEVEAALERERLARERGEERTVLFPVRLDDVVKTTTKAWAAKLRRQRVE